MRYLPIKQQPYCCVPASLCMVLARRGLLGSLTQLRIGQELGLTLPDDGMPEPPAGWGTRIDLPQYSLQNFFTSHKIPLRYDHIFPDSADALAELLLLNLPTDDVLVCFDHRKLYGSGGGHVCVVESIKGDKVSLIETRTGEPNVKEASINRLYQAMVAHGPRNLGGVWLISLVTV